MNGIRRIQPKLSLRDELEATMAERDKYARFVNKNLCGLSITLEQDTGFHIEAQACSTAGFTVARFATEGGRALLDRRSVEIGSDGQDRYAILVPMQSSLEITQFGRRAEYPPGTLGLLSTSEPFFYRKLGNNDTIYLFLPHEFADSRLPDAMQQCGRRVPAFEGMWRLARSAIIALQLDASSMTAAELLESARMVGELTLLACCARTDVASNFNPVRAANLARAKRIIRKRHTDPELTLQDIAAECGLSLRYLHTLFREDGCSFRDHLIQERLRSARRLLELSEPSTTTVTEICVASGFSNPSFFSTAFRRAYAVCPRDVLYHRRSRSF
jgi:AraC-like DNA-binding protein